MNREKLQNISYYRPKESIGYTWQRVRETVTVAARYEIISLHNFDSVLRSAIKNVIDFTFSCDVNLH